MEGVTVNWTCLRNVTNDAKLCVTK